MKKYYLIILICLVVIVLILLKNNIKIINSNSQVAENTQTNQNLTDSQIFDEVKKAVLEKGIEPHWTKTDCIFYEVNQDDDSKFKHIEIREKHFDNEECPGDKNTAPLSGIYRISNDTRTVEWLSIYENEHDAQYVSLDRYAEFYKNMITD